MEQRTAGDLIFPAELAPGESVDIPITIAAPTTPGSYTLRHRVVKEGVRWFNSLLKSTVEVGTFSATYAGTIPAEITEATTRIFPITVTNTGTVPWTSTSLEPLQLGYYFNAAGETTPPSLASAVMLPLGTTIGVGESLTLDVPLVTPATAGEYRLEFRLARGNHALAANRVGAERFHWDSACQL